MRIHAFSAFALLLAFGWTSVAVAQSDITSSAITHNLSNTAAGDLDSFETVWDWAVWTDSAAHTNEFAGGVATFGPVVFVGTQLGGSPTQRPVWTLDFTNAQNGTPPSGTTFGFGALWANPFSTNAMTLDVTPNLTTGSRGIIRIFGQTDTGGLFGGAFADSEITIGINGGTADPDATQAWSLVDDPVDTWMYEFAFENYDGDTFNFDITTDYFGLQPEHVLGAVLITVDEPSTVTADSVNALLGNQSGGQLEDTFLSDDSYLCYLRGAAFSPVLPSIILDFESTLPTDTPNELSVLVESRVNDIGISQEILMLNVNTGQFESLDFRGATFNSDGVVSVNVTGDLTRFVEAGTGLVQTRVTYIDDGTGFFINWQACIDQIIWGFN